MKKKIVEIAKVKKFRVLIPACAALLAYGAWAAFVNRHTDHQMLSGLSEGLRAFTFTTIGNLLTETVWGFYGRLRFVALRILASSLTTWMTIQGISFTIHSSINPGTALTTIAPALVISSVYVITYVIGLAELESRSIATEAL